jgi:D-alanyl-D-alanine carboxypeptidase/D-alanyl-D-alanine-endopeptidase (penicillin-binding protein 4)
VDSLLRAWGLPAGELRMVDGSGLSRYNLLTPELLVGLLNRMLQSPHRELWITSLPVAGQSGTLAGTLQDPALRGNVYAKTGTLSGIRALSGYLLEPGGEPVTFSILLNHHLRSAAEADRVIGAALAEIAAGQ